MKINYTLLVTWFLILVIVHCADTDLEVKKDPDGGLGTKDPSLSNQNSSLIEKTGGLVSDLDPTKADPLKKGKDQLGDSKGVKTDNLDENNSSKQLGHRESENVQTNANNSKSKKDGDKKEEVDKGSGSKDVPKEEKLPSQRKESFRGEQCDSSFTCTDESHGLVACLRVPGNESPELSLLIQNKGKGPLSVKITAPEFVRLEKTKIQLQEKEDKKVKVSIGDGKTDKFIVLKTGDSNCSLDFRDFIAHNPIKESDSMSKLTYTSLFRRTPFLGFIFLATILAIGSVLICVTFQRRRFVSNGFKYQKIDVELPVSGGAKTDMELKDGWDDSWNDDGWYDVEAAPMTPSMPVTPSLSSKGVAPRRVNKEGWKD